MSTYHKRIYYITEQLIYMNIGNKKQEDDSCEGVDRRQERLFFTTDMV